MRRRKRKKECVYGAFVKDSLPFSVISKTYDRFQTVIYAWFWTFLNVHRTHDFGVVLLLLSVVLGTAWDYLSCLPFSKKRKHNF